MYIKIAEKNSRKNSVPPSLLPDRKKTPPCGGALLQLYQLLRIMV